MKILSLFLCYTTFIVCKVFLCAQMFDFLVEKSGLDFDSRLGEKAEILPLIFFDPDPSPKLNF